MSKAIRESRGACAVFCDNLTSEATTQRFYNTLETYVTPLLKNLWM